MAAGRASYLGEMLDICGGVNPNDFVGRLRSFALVDVFAGYDWDQFGVELGKEKPLIRCPEWLPGDLPHDTGAWRISHNDGKMDGFAIGYGYVSPHALFAWAMASGERRVPRRSRGLALPYPRNPCRESAMGVVDQLLHRILSAEVRA